MRISIIVAAAEGGVIGRDGDIPWRLPDDWRRFKRLTMGHHLLVGRKTWESIGRPLPGRRMVVISRGRPELPDGVALAGSLDEALAIARAAGDEEAFVAGGAEIYRQALPRADRLYFTRIEARIEGDVRFPAWDVSAWRLVESEEHEADERHPHAFTFLVYEQAPRQPPG